MLFKNDLLSWGEVSFEYVNKSRIIVRRLRFDRNIKKCSERTHREYVNNFDNFLKRHLITS